MQRFRPIHGCSRPCLRLILSATLLLDPRLLQYAFAQEAQRGNNTQPRPAARADTGESKEARQSSMLELKGKLEKMFDALEEARKEIPRETFDPKVIIDGQPEVGFEGVGKDPIRLFEWVRDNTYVVPYRGVLRDYQGVLMDRVGNSLDRSLLLMRLLSDAGHTKFRLAHAELSDDKAAELLRRARPIPETGAMPLPKPAARRRLGRSFEKIRRQI